MIFELSERDLSDLADTLGDCYAYRVGEGDINDPEDESIWEADRENIAKAVRLAELFGVTLT
jgi:hypothetical protein